VLLGAMRQVRWLADIEGYERVDEPLEAAALVRAGTSGHCREGRRGQHELASLSRCSEQIQALFQFVRRVYVTERNLMVQFV
jgi:hypothetical protein